MTKLISCAVFVLLATTELARPALAQVPGGGGEAVCQIVEGGIVNQQSGGLFPIGPASCSLEAAAEASISIQPSVLLSANVDTTLVAQGDRNAAQAIVALQYSFTLTGGSPGDLVPVLVHTSMFTDVSPSDDPNNANVASANLNLFGLSAVGGSIIGSGPSANACAISPDSGDCFGGFEDDLALTMASGSAERVFMQIIVSASSNSGGAAGAQIDPFIFVDPRFAKAADYTITVSDGVANALPVPEPGTAALLLGGLGVVAGALRRRRKAWTVEPVVCGYSTMPVLPSRSRT